LFEVKKILEVGVPNFKRKQLVVIAHSTLEFQLHSESIAFHIAHFLCNFVCMLHDVILYNEVLASLQ